MAFALSIICLPGLKSMRSGSALRGQAAEAFRPLCGLGETRMPYTAMSPDDPELGALDFDHAYVNPISGVLANHVYNSLLAGRPYFLQMMEDAEIASRFATEKLGAKVTAVSGRGDAYTLAVAISETLRGVKLLPGPDARGLKWSEIVEEKRETWPIQYLLPSGAYIH